MSIIYNIYHQNMKHMSRIYGYTQYAEEVLHFLHEIYSNIFSQVNDLLKNKEKEKRFLKHLDNILTFSYFLKQIL
jgi:hypothetical protein